MARLARGEVVKERCTFYPQGEPVAVDCLTSGVRIDGGRLAMLIEGAALDVSPEELRALEALRHTRAMVSLYDGAGAALFRNPASHAIQPRSEAGFADRFADKGEAFRLWASARESATSAVLQVRTCQGLRWHVVDAHPVLDPATGGPGVLVNERDVTIEVDAQARIEHIATHDGLTDLPNRGQFRRRLEAALQAYAEGGPPPTLLCLDLDRFKPVNDGYGHLVGDGLLVAVAERLRACLGPGDLPARLGGDEFAVIHLGDGGATLAERLTAALSEPYEVAGYKLDVSASVGVARAHHAPDGVDALVGRADAALYAAKSAGRARWSVDGAPSPARRSAVTEPA
ncbi:MAG: GGDEF domain-containing protein [Methylobacteriaceae bacterium]|nr:GGDEF domain-containing protein [Methylobacteriaceae bacterium]